MSLQHTDEQPVRMHARVPVEAPKKSRMQLPRRCDVRRAREHMVEFAWILALDVGEREAREAACVIAREHAVHERPCRARPPLGLLSCARGRAGGACGSESTWA